MLVIHGNQRVVSHQQLLLLPRPLPFRRRARGSPAERRRRALITDAQRGLMAVAPAAGHLGAFPDPNTEAFVLGENKAAKKSVSFPCVCQMVPSLLQLVRRGRGHLDAASRSCEILQSPPPCEDSTYDATERSICSGRHLPESPPTPPTPTHHRCSPAAPLPPSLQTATVPLS
ncbi:hypothetical protein EYF80_016483 [Liparis tanakae]|uniref:Uncharacterized protein n=1 Tax=Liparis tanakae TaxID=230148 RepID=A0A4Z2I685_9TELE|nr:hypothetical protein EYF80_016483 [Liparis tanakae]